MDWYLRNDDDLYGGGNYNLNSLNLFKEPSEYDIFRVNNAENQDYEIKPLDFFVEKETTKSNSKLDSPNHKRSEEVSKDKFVCNDFTNSNKKDVFDIKKVKRNINSISKYSTNDNILAKELNELSKFSPHPSNFIDHTQLFIPFDKLPLHQRMKIKREKAKFLLKRRINKEIFQYEEVIDKKPENECIATNIIEEDNILVDDSNSSSNMNQVKPIMDKREKKILRNRISAQQSRERRKREFEELQKFSQGLLEENNMLRKELEHKNKEINWLKAQVSKLCYNCSKYFIPDRESLTFVRGSPFLKYGIFTSFLVVICLIGSCLWDNSSNNRILLSEGNYIIEKRNLDKNYTLPSVDVKIDDYKNYLPKPIASKEIQVPFKEIEFIPKEEKINPEPIKVDLTTAINNNKIPYCSKSRKKRNEYVSKVKQRLFINKKNLKKKPDLCMNNNNFFWSIQKESYDFSQEENTFTNNYILKTNDHSNYISDFGSNLGKESSVVSIGDVMIDNQLRENIKSLLCQRPISSVEDKGFNTLLKQKIENESNDCLYLHLLLPGGSEIDSLNSKKEKDVFYELGCKIFEINKVYK